MSLIVSLLLKSRQTKWWMTRWHVLGTNSDKCLGLFSHVGFRSEIDRPRTFAPRNACMSSPIWNLVAAHFPDLFHKYLSFLSTSGYAKEDIYFYQHIVRLSFRNREGHTKNIWGARAINIYLTSLQLPFFPGIYSGNRERSRFQRPICSHALIVIHMVCMWGSRQKVRRRLTYEREAHTECFLCGERWG